ncbi:MAG: ABC transporter ATP-binding protein [Acetobacter sp.]|jgi:iron complex transport system ATP-binding protein|nr:ABC transporter ATP-binding protein [Acetobacter sp.]MCH4060675.1 ABC transporter ATP-binding protein [Acetobacter sp.]MCH4087615.1 ABC transporter ATP-binding protein [Acetobacter sp.]MCI1294263.1 ABC transporter ATP-binding protein [Acetobacter sp.]MCI1320848.1 ABC transporter ATP-binding protein [Acetobacter sp.]
MTLLWAQGLSLQLAGRTVIRDVDLQLEGGQVIGLIGPNGAGKSTLARVLAGLQKPDEGHIALMQRDMALLAPSARARQLAFIPQESRVPPPMAVRSLVALGRLPYGEVNEAAETHPMVDYALTVTELQNLSDRPASHLSGGERARMNLARALATDTPIVLADEPIAALDPAHALSMMRLFRKLAEQGKGVVIILHDLMLAARFCDYLIVMQEGSVACQGVPDDVLSDEMMHRVYGVTVRRIENAVVPWDLCNS